MEGELTTLVGPEGEDWRVPVSELESRQKELASRLREKGLEAALIQTPVDLYYYAGGRQNASLLVTAEGESGCLSDARLQGLSTNLEEMIHLILWNHSHAWPHSQKKLDVSQQCNLANYLIPSQLGLLLKLELLKTVLKSCIPKGKSRVLGNWK